MVDKRFEGIASDPRFNLPKKRQQKSKVDNRFKKALERDEFQSAKSDKYGRKIQEKTAKEKLERFYEFSESDKSDEGSGSDSESESDSDSDSDSNAAGSGSAAKLLERMRGDASSDDSSSDSEEDDDSDDDAIGSPITADDYDMGKSAVETGDESRRLAVVNLDWDNIRAVDLMVTFSSFVPKGHTINHVCIYPSEFGKERMQQEEMKGPSVGAESGKETTHDRDADYSSSALRKYQLQRLQYYYAVVDCDSIAAAAAIYDNCDGTEYEATANIFDLRYVPDEVTFDDTPTDECKSVPLGYQPQEFTTMALQHSKAKLTWDETPRERKEFTARAFSKADEEDMDMQAYLASDSDEDERTSADKYRALLNPVKDDDQEQDSEDGMEITFGSALDAKAAADSEPEANPLDNMSTIERYRLKEKERRQKRMERSKARKAEEAATAEKPDEKKKKAELDLLLMDDHNAEQDGDKKDEAEAEISKHKKKYKKTKSREKRDAIAEAEKDFNTADPRFQALFEDPDFAIDSTNPQFKKTKAMDKVLDERRKRHKSDEEPKPKRKQTARKEENVKDIVASLKKKQKTK